MQPLLLACGLHDLAPHAGVQRRTHGAQPAADGVHHLRGAHAPDLRGGHLLREGATGRDHRSGECSQDPAVDLEFVELYNTTPDTIDLSGWRIQGGIEFSFPRCYTLSMAAAPAYPRELRRYRLLCGILGVAFVLLWASLFSLLFAACFWLVLRISLETLSMDLITHCQQLLDTMVAGPGGGAS